MAASRQSSGGNPRRGKAASGRSTNGNAPGSRSGAESSGKSSRGGSSGQGGERKQTKTEDRKRSSADAAGSREDYGTAESERDRWRMFYQSYYPVFEALALLILQPRQWFQAFQSFLKEQARYRSELLLWSLLWFVAGFVFVLGALVFLIYGVFLTIAWLSGSKIIAAFAGFAVFLAAAVWFFRTMLKTAGKLFEAKEYGAEDD